MIDHLDNLLRQLFISEIDEITSEAQVRFQPPDEEWRTFVANLTVAGRPANALNVYLVDLRENRKLRRANEIPGGSALSHWRSSSDNPFNRLARRRLCHLPTVCVLAPKASGDLA